MANPPDDLPSQLMSPPTIGPTRLAEGIVEALSFASRVVQIAWDARLIAGLGGIDESGSRTLDVAQRGAGLPYRRSVKLAPATRERPEAVATGE
jgi:hypothetical protein